MKIISLRSIKLVAHARRPGYVEACLRHGKLDAGGKLVEFSDEAHARLRHDYALRGAGDLAEAAIRKIPGVSLLPCHDRQTHDLKPQSGCAQRRNAMNKALPFTAQAL